MPRTHEIGKTRFIQLLDNYKVMWNWKLLVKGWTQEIEPPYRYATPLILRLPKNKALVYGKWISTHDEESALNRAMQGRVLSDEDFQEGWTPAAYENPEEGSEYIYS